jgi:hypothetical protein
MLGTLQLLRNRKLRQAIDALFAPRPIMEAIEERLLLSGNGLSAIYFDNADLTGKSVSRTDATVNFNWYNGSPNSAIAPDSFSARWTGQILADKTQTYTFYATADDGVRLWIDGKQIINDWTDHAAREDKGTISLVAGRKYDVKLEYYDRRYGATVRLAWSGAATSKQIVPQSQLFSATAVTPPDSSGPTPVPPPGTSTGGDSSAHGLLATYFDNVDLTGKTVSRTDATVNFNWYNGSPNSAIAPDSFSARWTGQVLADKTQVYTFYTTSDDGVRLWVDGKEIINNWTDHGVREDKGAVSLVAGKKYAIKLEYYDRRYGAVIKLAWSGAGTSKQVIPQSQLFSTTAVTPPSGSTPTPPVTPTPPSTSGSTGIHGLLGSYYDNLDYSGSSITRYDANVSFDWGGSSPSNIIGRDTWAARWQGQVVIPKTETYTFSITTDGGARLYVDGKVVIDDWANHDKRERSGAVTLSAGKHDIKLDYYVVSGSAVAQLRWSSPSIARQFIPSANLFAAAPPQFPVSLPAATPFTGFKHYTSSQVNYRPANSGDKQLLLDGYRISKMPINSKGINISVTDPGSGQRAWAYNNITIRNTEISDIYRTSGYHNDFIRIGGAAGRQDTPMNITLENVTIHDGQAIPILITDGDYDTITIRNVKITNCSINQLQINCQNVGSVKRIIVENCPGLHVAMVGKVGTIKECYVRNSPDAAVGDSLNQQGTKSGVKIVILP